MAPALCPQPRSGPTPFYTLGSHETGLNFRVMQKVLRHKSNAAISTPMIAFCRDGLVAAPGDELFEQLRPRRCGCSELGDFALANMITTAARRGSGETHAAEQRRSTLAQDDQPDAYASRDLGVLWLHHPYVREAAQHDHHSSSGLSTRLLHGRPGLADRVRGHAVLLRQTARPDRS